MNALESLALDALYAEALPVEIPGAWIRDAIDRMRANDADPASTGERMHERSDFINWPLDVLMDHLCELTWDAKEMILAGAGMNDTLGRILAVRAEIQKRATVASKLHALEASPG